MGVCVVDVWDLFELQDGQIVYMYVYTCIYLGVVGVRSRVGAQRVGRGAPSVDRIVFEEMVRRIPLPQAEGGGADEGQLLVHHQEVLVVGPALRAGGSGGKEDMDPPAGMGQGQEAGLGVAGVEAGIGEGGGGG